MLIRHATPAEMTDPVDFTVGDPIGSIDSDRFLEEAAAGRLRPEWTLFAEDDHRIVARAVVGARRQRTTPRSGLPPRAPGGGRSRRARDRDPASRARRVRHGTRARPRAEHRLARRPRRHLGRRVAGRRRPGGRPERRRRTAPPRVDARGLRARSGEPPGLPARRGRRVPRRVPAGRGGQPRRRHPARPRRDDAGTQARGDLEFYRSCPGRRSWWRLAETTDGELAGVAVPSATPYHRNAGYLGVVPEMRGRGYVDEVLGEITRLHAADGADRITATTDVSNTPMAAAFERAGYRVTEVRMVFEAPPA